MSERNAPWANLTAPARYYIGTNRLDDDAIYHISPDEGSKLIVHRPALDAYDERDLWSLLCVVLTPTHKTIKDLADRAHVSVDDVESTLTAVRAYAELSDQQKAERSKKREFFKALFSKERR